MHARRADRPSDLSLCLEANQYRGGYNEVIINSKAIDENLPWAIDGFFYIGDGAEAAARATHADFLARFPAVDAVTHPLMRLRLTEWDEPLVQVAR